MTRARVTLLVNRPTYCRVFSRFISPFLFDQHYRYVRVKSLQLRKWNKVTDQAGWENHISLRFRCPVSLWWWRFYRRETRPEIWVTLVLVFLFFLFFRLFLFHSFVGSLQSTQSTGDIRKKPVQTSKCRISNGLPRFFKIDTETSWLNLKDGEIQF